jgi:hypothetical protein
VKIRSTPGLARPDAVAWDEFALQAGIDYVEYAQTDPGSIREPACGLNFTGAQWQKICSAVWDGCARPDCFDTIPLLLVANNYK